VVVSGSIDHRPVPPYQLCECRLIAFISEALEQVQIRRIFQSIIAGEPAGVAQDGIEQACGMVTPIAVRAEVRGCCIVACRPRSGTSFSEIR
jgi:hypothetical protein